MKPNLTILVAVSIVLIAALTGSGGVQSVEVVENGSILIYFLQQQVGEEKYEVRRTADGLDLSAAFEYTERGTTVPLNGRLRMKPDLTPQFFEVKGRSYRPFTVDATVEISGNTAMVRDVEQRRQAPVPQRFFAVSGYSPLSVQAMMIRYWERNGRPAELPTFPAITPDGNVRIARSGDETITIEGRPVKLVRYTVENVVWGRESVWLDERGQFAAATTFSGGLGLEAVRREYASAFKQFINSSVADRMKDFDVLSAAVKPEAAGSFALVGGTLITGTGGSPLENSAVLVRDGRIVAAGPRSQVSIPQGVRVIDAAGKTLIPGLWEMHAHYSQIEYGPAYLASGVTTARDLGGEFEFLAAMKAKVENTAGVSPRLLLAGIVDGEGPTRFGVNSADTPEQARAIVARYKNAGFSQIKIYSLVRPDILRVLTAEAHRNGMTVTGHIPRGMNVMEATEAGMDEICHMGGVSALLQGPDGGAAAIRILKERGAGFDTTLAWGELQGRPKNIPMSSFEPGMAKAPYSLASLINSAGGAEAPEYRPEVRFRDQVAAIRKLLDAGIPVVAGTDKAVPGHSLLRELELYVAGGMEPGEVIRIATIGAARAMKLDHEVGTIEAGKRADLVVLDGNPLEDFRNIRKIGRVITAGRIYDPARLWQSVGFKP